MNDLNQKLLNALNVQGILFQDKCLNIFSENGWQVVPEYPVIFPKPAFGNFGKECVIDIWAKKQLSEVELNFLIECKKADPKLKNWVFFVDKFDKTVGTGTIAFTQGEDSKWVTKTFLQDLRSNLKKTFSLDNEKTCFFALETKEKFTKSPQKDDTKSSTGRILDAAYQAVQATNGTFHEYGEYYSKLQNSELTKEKKSVILIPVVITTANLFIAEYDLVNVGDNGEISKVDHINFLPNDIIFYNYPIPGHIRFPMMDEDIPKISLDQRLGYKKTLVLIVNFNFLAELLSKIR